MWPFNSITSWWYTTPSSDSEMISLIQAPTESLSQDDDTPVAITATTSEVVSSDEVTPPSEESALARLLASDEEWLKKNNNIFATCFTRSAPSFNLYNESKCNKYINQLWNYKKATESYLPKRRGSSKYVFLDDIGRFDVREDDFNSEYIFDILNFLNKNGKYCSLKNFRRSANDILSTKHYRVNYVKDLFDYEVIDSNGKLVFVNVDDYDDEDALINKVVFNRKSHNPRDEMFMKFIDTHPNVKKYSSLFIEKNEEAVPFKNSKTSYYNVSSTQFQYMYFLGKNSPSAYANIADLLHFDSFNRKSKYSYYNSIDREIVIADMCDAQHIFLETQNLIVPFETKQGTVYIFWDQLGIYDKNFLLENEYVQQQNLIWEYSAVSPVNGKRYLRHNRKSDVNWGTGSDMIDFSDETFFALENIKAPELKYR
jgi:hypothetical protein